MTAFMSAPLLLVAVPVISATVGLAFRNQPDALKVWLLLATMATLGTLGWTAGQLPPKAAGLSLLALLPITAFVSLLGQPLHPRHGPAWLLTLLLLGLGLGVLALDATLATLCFGLLVAILGLTLATLQQPAGHSRWWGIATLGLAAMALLVAAVTAPPVSSIAFALACAIALPLVPFHTGYLAALTALPGNLPAFLAVLLPVIGFHGLATTLVQIPSFVLDMAGTLALTGCLYGSIRALAQSRPGSVTAYGSLAFHSILWWYLVRTGDAGSPTLVYVSAVGLATSGLLLASFFLQGRYGEIGLRGLSGLAPHMPRFAVVLSLLALAALGLPPFGVFAGLFGMLLAPSFHWSGGLFIIMSAWLAASWYLFDLTQGLVFGPPQADRRHCNDLGDPEFAALTIIVLLLVILGVLPSRLFIVGPPAQGTIVMGAPPWNQ